MSATDGHRTLASLEIRPLEAADRDRLAAAFARLSPEARYQRFLGPKPELSERELDDLTRLDGVSRDAVVGIEHATGRMVGVARYAAHSGTSSAADVAVAIADEWQGPGLGLTLCRALPGRAGATGFRWVTATVLHDNFRSRALLRRLGFRLRTHDGGVMEFAREL